MGLVAGLMLDPARIAFMAFLLATALELKNKTAISLMLGIGAIVFAVLMPTVFRPIESPARFISAGLVSNLLLLGIFYGLYSLVLRRLEH